MARDARSYPLRILKYFHTDLYSFFRLVSVGYGMIAEGTMPDEPGNRDIMKRNYIS